MRKILVFVAGLVLTVALLAPTGASAAGFSFGGRVVSIIPCSGGMFHVTIAPAGLFSPAYIWTPATIMHSVGFPVLGGQILGVADVPFVCFVGGGFFVLPIPLPGFRMQEIGTSFPSV